MALHKMIAFLLAASVATAAQAAQAPSPLVTKAKALIAGRMNDPSSLQYRKLRVVNETVHGKALTVACGEFNAKNKMGGYVGFQTFAYEPTVLKGVMTFDGGNFDYFTSDGKDFETAGAFDEKNARILAVCLGLKQ